MLNGAVRNYRKPIASFLSLHVFFTNVVFCHSLESNFWAERRSNEVASLPLDFHMAPLLSSVDVSSKIKNQLPRGCESSLLPLLRALPQNIGTIRKIIPPRRGGQAPRIVLHIQDVHLNPEAQANIGQVVQNLADQNVVDLVALEGAFRPMDFSWYRAYPHHAAVNAVADYLLREKRISGPVFTAMKNSNPKFPAFVGVDDKPHYDANVEAYRRSAAMAGELKKQAIANRRTLSDAKAATFNSELKRFDDAVTAAHAGTFCRGVRMSRCWRSECRMFLCTFNPIWPRWSWNGKLISRKWTPNARRCFLNWSAN